MTRPDLGLPPPPWIVGHRGAAGEAPENTLDSLLLAVDQGADMVEIDLQLTSDGHLVACHDWDLRRMGGAGAVVEESDLAALREIEIGGPFRDDARPRRLASLEEIQQLLPATVPLNLELKRRRAEPAKMARRLAEVVDTRRPLLVSSFDWQLLEAVRATVPQLPRAPLGGRTADPVELIAAAEALAAWSVHCRHSLVERSLVESAGDRPVLAYTVDRPDVARRLFGLGVSGVFSNHPGRLRRLLEDRS